LKAAIEPMVGVVSFLAKQIVVFRRHRGQGLASLSEPEEAISENTNVWPNMICNLSRTLAEREKRSPSVSPTCPTEVKI